MASNALAVAADDFKGKLARRLPEYAKVLPSHITPEHFERVTRTAVAQNPKLFTVDENSLFNAIMRCAEDGLLPDGRQAVLVVYNTRDRGPIAQYQQMTAGIRKLVQQSGEITRFEQTVVYENDDFEFELGDHPHIRHRPRLTKKGQPVERGEPILAYSVAQFRDGTLSREIMTVEEIEKVRAISRAADSGPWVEWWPEMARKTVARRHAKILPMSTDAADIFERGLKDEYEFRPPTTRQPKESRPRLAERLETLAPHTQPGDSESEVRRRGRPRKKETSASELDEIMDDPRHDHELPDDKRDDLEPAPEPEHSADYLAGVKDKARGAAACLDRDIKDDPRRLAEWSKGFNSRK